ncbi:MAG: helix-turn-helix transcriptional regulator [Bacillota bacterium]
MPYMSERTKHIIQQLASGKSMAAVARELRVSRQAVNQIVWREYRRYPEQARVAPRKNEFGVTELRVLRTARGLTLSRAAAGMHMSVQTLLNMEKGKVVELRKARQVAEFYDVPVGALFALADECAEGNLA